MTDTDFYVESDKLERVAHGFDAARNDYSSNLWNVSIKPNIASGGGGLVSTISDYAKFSQMLLNRGHLDGKILLSPKTIDFMLSNHLTDNLIDQDEYYLPQTGYGFGLGVAVRLEDGKAHSAGSQGDFRWGGAAGTAFWIDPKEELILLFMVQHIGSSYHLRERFKALVYQAIIE